jgi:hypothetical protein
MEIRRLGKIFDPRDYDLPLGAEEFAQSPQALVTQDFIRIYFSTRSRDDSKKFLSQVAYVDMDRGLRSVIRVSQHEVIPLGNLGCFDEHGIFPFHVTRDQARILAYTTGWSRRTSVSVETGIGLAVSEDEGRTFRKLGDGPIVTASLLEPFLVGDAFVRFFEGQFHMWYIYGQEWRKFAADAQPDRIYKIGHATSDNGIDWKRCEGEQIIPDALGPDESQALPSVLKHGDTYHMVFCYRESFDFRETRGRGYRLGYAKSADLKNWERIDSGFSTGQNEGQWDSDMQAYPHLFSVDDRVVLLYNGNQFGRFGFGALELSL